MKQNAFKHKDTRGETDSLKQNSGTSLQDNRPKSIVQRQANNTGLPDKLKEGIENLSGHAMDDVKVHYNSSKPAQLNAHAYAQGSEIHLGSGQEKHLPHEAWHVVQQKQGRVKPTKQLKAKVNINDDEKLEKEADTMGEKALQLKVKGSNVSQKNLLCQASFPIQLVRVGLAEYGLAGKERPAVVEKYHSPEQSIMQLVTFGGGNSIMIGGRTVAAYTKDVWGMTFNPKWQGRLQYVVDLHGNFYGEYYPPGINERKNEFHSRFKGGGNVISAGWMKIVGSRVANVANDSGHYKPGTDGFYKMLVIMKKLGVDVAKIRKRTAAKGAGTVPSSTRKIAETLSPGQIRTIRAQVDAMFAEAQVLERRPAADIERPQAPAAQVEPDAEMFVRLMRSMVHITKLLAQPANHDKIESVEPLVVEAKEVLGRVEIRIKAEKPVNKDSFRLAEILLIQAENRILMKT